jgi:quinol monooxygenase YgiN
MIFTVPLLSLKQAEMTPVCAPVATSRGEAPRQKLALRRGGQAKADPVRPVATRLPAGRALPRSDQAIAPWMNRGLCVRCQETLGGESPMYGTVARMRLKPGMEAKLKEEMAQYEGLKIPGFVSTMVYRMDRDPNEIYMAVAFKDKESYHANARDPKQDERFRKMRAFLAAEPEWHDGEIIASDKV